MNTYDQIVIKIIKEQELLMGPVAWYEASKVSGLQLDQRGGAARITAEKDSRQIVDALVDQYGSLFGRAAREVCREAVTAIIADLPQSEVPASLK